jgi:hypothetical protein
MSDLTRVLIAFGISVVLTVAIVLLAQRSQRQFAIGTAATFFSMFGISLSYPSVISSSGPFWAEGYTTAFPAVTALYAIAQIAIWRGFSKPRWLAFFCTLVPATLISMMGFWEMIQ